VFTFLSVVRIKFVTFCVSLRFCFLSPLHLTNKFANEVEYEAIAFRAMPKGKLETLLRKEVIQPQVPLRLPCYDFTPVTNPTFAGGLLAVTLTVFWLSQLPWCDGRCVQGPGTYSPRRADPRLLAIPPS
jgi:hypothetical protein